MRGTVKQGVIIMLSSDEKLDQLISMVGNLKTKLSTFQDEMYEFRRENKQEHELLRSQIASVAEALNPTIVSDDERLKKLEQRVDMLQRVQDMHSTEILKLRAAI